MNLLQRLLAMVIALALATFGVLTTLEVIWAATASHQPLVLPYITLGRRMRAVEWSDPAVLAALAALVALGLVIIVTALLRGPRKRLRMHEVGTAPYTTTRIDVKGLRRVAGNAATSVDGISRATVRAGRRTVRVTATSRLRDSNGQADLVRQRVTAALQELSLSESPRVKVALDQEAS